MTDACKHTWQPFTRWKVKCRKCRCTHTWGNLLVERGWADGTRRHPLTQAEADIVGLVVEQIRNAMADNVQLSMTFDGFAMGGGAHVSFMHSASGFTVTIEGDIQKKRAHGARRTRIRRARR